MVKSQMALHLKNLSNIYINCVPSFTLSSQNAHYFQFLELSSYATRKMVPIMGRASS